MASKVSDSLSPKAAGLGSSPRRSNEEGLRNLGTIFNRIFTENATPDEMREFCCKAVLQDCRKGDLQRIERAKNAVASLRDAKGRHPIAILRENNEDKAADLLAKVLIQLACTTFEKEGNSKNFKDVLLPQLCDVYLEALKVEDRALLNACKEALGAFVSGESDDLTTKDPCFAHLTPTLGKRLWKAAEKYNDSVLKTFCAMLYKSFPEHKETLPSKLAKLVPQGFTIPFAPYISINEKGLSSLHWLVSHSSASYMEQIGKLANMIGIEHVYLDIEPKTFPVHRGALSQTLSSIPSLRSLELSSESSSITGIKGILSDLLKSCKITVKETPDETLLPDPQHVETGVVDKKPPQIRPPAIPLPNSTPSPKSPTDIITPPEANTQKSSPCPPTLSRQASPEWSDKNTALHVLEKVIDKTPLTQQGDVFSAKKALLQGLKELREEHEQLAAQGSSQEQLRARALVLRQDLKKEVEDQNKQLIDLGDLQLEIHHQLTEIKRKLAMKGEAADLQRLEGEQKVLEERAAVIEAQVAILMNERDIKEQKRQAIKKFQSDPNALLYYRTVQIKLEELFISFKAVAGGFVPVVSGDLAIYQTLLSVIGDHATIVPIIGDAAQKILNIASFIVGKVDGERQNNTAMNASQLVTLSEMKKYAESIARQLTENYAEQLQLLATPDQEQAFQSSLQKKGDQIKKVVTKSIHCPPAKQFAAFGVFWLVQELCNVHQLDLKTEDLDRVLITAISQKTPPDRIRSFWQEITKKLNLDGIPDKNGAIRHPEEFYTLSGIRTENGHYYSGLKQQPDIFGWRIGTGEDAQKLLMRKVPTPADRAQKKESGIKHEQLVERDIKLDHHEGRLERLEKTDLIAGGAKAKALLLKLDEWEKNSEKNTKEMAQKIAELNQQLKAQANQLKVEQEKREMLEKEQKASAEQLKAVQEQLALLAKALGGKLQDPVS